jgi:hypothetical protein
MQSFKSRAYAQRFLTTHAAIKNSFCTQLHLIRRQTLRRIRNESTRIRGKPSPEVDTARR